MSISDEIRNAALSWPLGFLGDVDSEIVWTFIGWLDDVGPRFFSTDDGRVFLLLVSEALK